MKKVVLVIRKLRKPKDGMQNSWLNETCPRCNCRLRTDFKLIWCSNPACDFVKMRQYSYYAAMKTR